MGLVCECDGLRGGSTDVPDDEPGCRRTPEATDAG